MLAPLLRLTRALSDLALAVSAFGLVGMTVAVSWQVFGRYVLNDSPTWTEPLAIQLMGWFILLGAAVGIRDGSHLGFDVIRLMAPKRLALAMDLFCLFLIGLFGAAMAFYGLQLVRGTWTATLPVLGWPGGVDFLPIVVGGALLALFSVEQILLRLGAEGAKTR